MANEAVILELNEHMDAMQFTCASSASLSKGQLLKLSGDNIVGASSAASDVYAGVAAADHDPTDSSTTVGVYVPGQMNKFDMKVGTGTVPLGALVSLSGANLIGIATAAEILTGDVIGKAMEAGAASEVIVVIS